MAAYKLAAVKFTPT